MPTSSVSGSTASPASSGRHRQVPGVTRVGQTSRCSPEPLAGQAELGRAPNEDHHHGPAGGGGLGRLRLCVRPCGARAPAVPGLPPATRGRTSPRRSCRARLSRRWSPCPRPRRRATGPALPPSGTHRHRPGALRRRCRRPGSGTPPDRPRSHHRSERPPRPATPWMSAHSAGATGAGRPTARRPASAVRRTDIDPAGSDTRPLTPPPAAIPAGRPPRGHRSRIRRRPVPRSRTARGAGGCAPLPCGPVSGSRPRC